LKADVFERFLSKKFASGKRGIERDVLAAAMELSDHVPGDVQCIV
jgi:hypothetical protein